MALLGNMLAVKENVLLAPYTVYKIGGPARFLVEVRNADELQETLQFAEDKKLPFFILGAGSNVLVSDKGYDGVVIRLVGGGIDIHDTIVIVSAGVMMAQLVAKTSSVGLTGLEWGIGIPGTVGGSVRGNAGCFGGEVKDVVESVRVMGFPGWPLKEFSRRECEFGYRDSIFKKRPEWIIVSVTFVLHEGDPKEIQENIKRITAERAQKQDIGTKSCGCIFKNVSWKSIDKEVLLKKFPELEQFKDNPNIPASYLIDHAGLKGRRVGHVFISPKHANYFVNDGGATAEEVVALIAAAKETVGQTYGLNPEEEIQYLGF